MAGTGVDTVCAGGAPFKPRSGRSPERGTCSLGQVGGERSKPPPVPSADAAERHVEYNQRSHTVPLDTLSFKPGPMVQLRLTFIK
jgi:hypothetical protein